MNAPLPIEATFGTYREGIDSPVNEAGEYNAANNSRRSYDLAIAAAREACIRRGQIKPDPSRPQEVRWSQQGPVSPDQLEAVRG